MYIPTVAGKACCYTRNKAFLWDLVSYFCDGFDPSGLLEPVPSEFLMTFPELFQHSLLFHPENAKGSPIPDFERIYKQIFSTKNPLHIAILAKDLEMVELLLDNGLVDITQQDLDGNTVITLASAEQAPVTITKKLLNKLTENLGDEGAKEFVQIKNVKGVSAADYCLNRNRHDLHQTLEFFIGEKGVTILDLHFEVLSLKKEEKTYKGFKLPKEKKRIEDLFSQVAAEVLAKDTKGQYEINAAEKLGFDLRTEKRFEEIPGVQSVPL